LVNRALAAVREEITSNARIVGAVRGYHDTIYVETKRVDSLEVIHTYADFAARAPAWSGFKNPEYDA
jgi:hypothetical protein